MVFIWFFLRFDLEKCRKICYHCLMKKILKGSIRYGNKNYKNNVSENQACR